MPGVQLTFRLNIPVLTSEISTVRVESEVDVIKISLDKESTDLS